MASCAVITCKAEPGPFNQLPPAGASGKLQSSLKPGWDQGPGADTGSPHPRPSCHHSLSSPIPATINLSPPCMFSHCNTACTRHIAGSPWRWHCYSADSPERHRVLLHRSAPLLGCLGCWLCRCLWPHHSLTQVWVVPSFWLLLGWPKSPFDFFHKRHVFSFSPINLLIGIF